MGLARSHSETPFAAGARGAARSEVPAGGGGEKDGFQQQSSAVGVGWGARLGCVKRPSFGGAGASRSIVVALAVPRRRRLRTPPSV